MPGGYPLSSSIQNIEIVRQWLQDSRRVAVLTGAGISAESGVPTFRKPAALPAANDEAKSSDRPVCLWEKYDPADLASQSGFKRNPQLVWQWYDYRRCLVENVQPNAGHLALAQLEAQLASTQNIDGGGSAFTLITQNVDRLHQRAGSKNILEVHGNILTFRCFDHGHQAAEVERGLSDPPLCNPPHCNSLIRPNVVWFGEALDKQTLEAASSAAERCDLFIAIGTSALVQPAASLPHIAAAAGAKLVEVNIEMTPLTNIADIFLKGAAGEILPLLLKCPAEASLRNG
jgi:NAD-dependent deacetylase